VCCPFSRWDPRKIRIEFEFGVLSGLNPSFRVQEKNRVENTP
jgi:hypothetical protein